MKFNKVTAVWFSPTGNTRKVVQTVADTLAAALQLPRADVDLTLPAGRGEAHSFGPEDLVVFGTPTYAGRIPNKMQPTFAAQFHGEGTAAVALALYGNRSFQDALSELNDLLRENGFVTVGGASVVSEHVFSDKLAQGRPNADDLAALTDFAQQLAERLKTSDVLTPVAVPGNDPVGPYYTPLGVDGQPAKFLKATPKTTDAWASASSARPASRSAPSTPNTLTTLPSSPTWPCWRRTTRHGRKTVFICKQRFSGTCILQVPFLHKLMDLAVLRCGCEDDSIWISYRAIPR